MKLKEPIDLFEVENGLDISFQNIVESLKYPKDDVDLEVSDAKMVGKYIQFLEDKFREEKSE